MSDGTSALKYRLCTIQRQAYGWNDESAIICHRVLLNETAWIQEPVSVGDRITIESKSYEVLIVGEMVEGWKDFLLTEMQFTANNQSGDSVSG